MMYASHVSWSSPVSPVPAELYPSLAFDSLFESRGSQTHLSVLDHVLEQLNDVSRRVSKSDRAKIDEYATSVREVEQRLERLQKNQQDLLAQRRAFDAEKAAIQERHNEARAKLQSELDDANREKAALMASNEQLSMEAGSANEKATTYQQKHVQMLTAMQGAPATSAT